MYIASLPTPFQTAFRPACFSLGGMDTPPAGIDVHILTPTSPTPLGVKHVFAPKIGSTYGSVTVNASPYARTLLAIEPLCGLPAGPVSAASRLAPCQVFAPSENVGTAIVSLTGGAVDAPQNEILSDGPSVVAIAAGEKDEISVITPTRVVPEVVFSVDGVMHTDRSMAEISSKGMITVVVDAADVIARAAAAVGSGSGSGSGAGAGSGAAIGGSPIDEFTVRLRLVSSSGIETRLERRYLLRKTSHSTAGIAAISGRRVAWVNRYGAVDYYTFPVVSAVRHSGRTTTIDTPVGLRTTGTANARTQTLVSEPVDDSRAEWLAEILSSSAVWAVDGSNFERVKVSGGHVATSPMKPTHVKIDISPATTNPSRK